MTNPIPSSHGIFTPVDFSHVLQAALNSLKFKQPEPSASNTLLTMTEPWRPNISGGIVLLFSGLGVGFVGMVIKSFVNF